MIARGSVLAIVVLAFAAGDALAQTQVMPPLAEVARKAEAAKPTVKKARKTYTNSDLSADPRSAPPPPPAAAPSAPAAAAATPAAKSEGTDAAAAAPKAEEAVQKESEETWRMRAASLRKQVDTMRARIAELTLPDPLREENPVLKRANDVEIANARAAFEGLKTQWSRLEASARELKVPEAWLEPRPQLQ